METEMTKVTDKDIININGFENIHDVVLFSGIFPKGKDMGKLSIDFESHLTKSIFIKDTDTKIIMLGIGNKHWYNRVKKKELDKVPGDIVIFIDINGPIFKKSTYSSLDSITTVFKEHGGVEIIAKLINSLS